MYMIVQEILSRITARSPMVGTPIDQVRRLINQGLIKDLMYMIVSILFIHEAIVLLKILHYPAEDKPHAHSLLCLNEHHGLSQLVPHAERNHFLATSMPC